MLLIYNIILVSETIVLCNPVVYMLTLYPVILFLNPPTELPASLYPVVYMLTLYPVILFLNPPTELPASLYPVVYMLTLYPVILFLNPPTELPASLYPVVYMLTLYPVILFLNPPTELPASLYLLPNSIPNITNQQMYVQVPILLQNLLLRKSTMSCVYRSQ